MSDGGWLEEGQKWLREHPELFERGNGMSDDNKSVVGTNSSSVWATLLTLGLSSAWKWWKNRKRGKA